MLTRPTHKSKEWQTYIDREIEGVIPILLAHDIVLDKDQPHIKGEKRLFSTKKVVLLGTLTPKNIPVVIKASSHTDGKKEICHEKRCRDALDQLNFIYTVFSAPKELAYIKDRSYTIMVTTFVKEARKFLDHTQQEQFFLTLKVFETQEGVHATAHKHTKIVKRLFDITTTPIYLKNLESYITEIEQSKEIKSSKDISDLLKIAQKTCKENEKYISLYGSFLSHIDLVPHNIRLADHVIYVLDHSDFHIANKHEGWARFLNYMILYNRDLESMVIEYLQKDRSPEEMYSLKTMRVYKLVELMAHYARTLQSTEGNLKILNTERFYFWKDILHSIVYDTPVDNAYVETYRIKRDSLRSADEKTRQKELH